MSKQSEATLEESLIKQLESLEYERVYIKDEKELLENLKKQLEIHNKTTFSQTEFQRVLNHLNKGDIFEKATILRDKYPLLRDDNITTFYVEFLDSINWCQNIFQVTSQVTIEGKYKNRYDVTLLINGLPLVQIELKRRGLELKEAFNQINRYQKHSYGFNSALFSYIQIFVISNGVNTKYYSNNKKQSFKQTFFWADEKNNNITDLSLFTKAFLEKCHISKMICRYIVLAQVPKILMVLRPYQFWAVEAIINRVENTNKNGYIWHTTGSGKTLTSFKASQSLTSYSDIKKVVFVVDRKDLDSQTTLEFNSFSSGSVDGTDNTKTLVEQFLGEYKDKKGELKDSKLIITTIQKLNSAISKKRHLDKMSTIKDEKIVFIFDECHRSQFGETHKNIVKFFTNAQLIGFTGTPIFEENALGNRFGKRTTAELFCEMLHQYIITNAIKDENVLKFSVEYVGRYKKKDSANEIDIKVEGIDTKELFESQERVEKIVEYILANHDRKTHSKEFNSMMAVSSVEVLCKYYEAFKAKNHNLKIATIFSYSANEEDIDANGIYGLDDSDFTIDESNINLHSRDKLEEYIGDYNKLFDTNYTTKDTKSFYLYYDDISRRTKKKEIDILLVVNMFLTGFDAPQLNTLYVDKSLRYHGLIQAFSRTNRILNEKKSQGNIVCFRNLKSATDEAIALFSNKDNEDKVLMEPYEIYVEKFNEIFMKLLQIAPSVSSVDKIIDENIQFEFIKTFRELIRVKNILAGFADFKWSDLSMSEQQFEDYKSKYLDLYDKIRAEKESKDGKVSILKDVDFELELIHKDEINVSYILNLLVKYSKTKTKDKTVQKENINNLINSNPNLRSKKELIEEFINVTLEGIDIKNIEEEFFKFIDIKKDIALKDLCIEEELYEDKTKELIENYLYDGRKPMSDDIVNILKIKPKILERKFVIPKVSEKIIEFVEKFYNFV